MTVALLRQVFQLTHSRGVRLVIFAFAPCRGKHFNSRTHVECDVNTAGIFIPTNDFNSRTHVECDIIHRFDSLVKQISTHALTWSATKSYFVRRLDSQISTHALTWSATESCFIRQLDIQISTHALTWSATSVLLIDLGKAIISTHALTWSATDNDCRKRTAKKFQLTHSRGVRLDRNGRNLTPNFNSRTHVECDKYIPVGVYTIIEFQLTHSRGVRPGRSGYAAGTAYFNSRTHVECDSKYCIKKRFTTQYMGIYCFLSSIILIFFIYSKK